MTMRPNQLVRVSILMDRKGDIHSVEGVANTPGGSITIDRKWKHMSMVEKGAVFGTMIQLYPILRRGRA